MRSAADELVRAEELLKSGATLALVGEEEIVRQERGVKPLLDLLKEGRDVRGYVAADRVVGKAAALLYVLLGVKAVYADVMSKVAEKVLRENGIFVKAAKRTERIVNRAGNGFCPMESAVMETDDPDEAFRILSERTEAMRKGSAHGEILPRKI